ncbi:MAG: alpha/beta family hydrolase [Bacilli bacterium]
MPVEYANHEVQSRWGRPARYSFARRIGGSEALAILLPGQGYTLDAPLLYYAGRAALQAGCDVLGVEYGFQSNRAAVASTDFPDIVAEVSDALTRLAPAGQYRRHVFIGKSIGTAILCEVAERLALPVRNHVFLTPLRSTISFIRQAENALVIVGDRDPLFVAADVEQVSGLSHVELEVVAGGDHSLEIEGDITASLNSLQRVTQLCKTFCDSLL